MKTTDFRTDVLPQKDKIFRLALRITLDRSEAEDIAQETLIRIWEKRDEWHQIENMEAYSLTIARRLALDHTKSLANKSHDRSYGTKSEEETIGNEVRQTADSTPLPDEQLDQRQRLGIIRNLIDQLPEVQRTIMLLRDIEGHRYDKIAQVTSLSETQVKVYLHRARTKVREALTRMKM